MMRLDLLLTAAACAAAAYASTPMELGEQAMEEYDFATARTNFKKAAAQKPAFEGDDTPGVAAEKLQQATLAQEMMNGQVQQIEVIDAINVPAKDFFKRYPIDPASGCMVDASALERSGAWADLQLEGPAFLSESGNLFYATDTSDEDTYRLYEGFTLGGGGLSEPRAVFDEDVDCAFPFMLSDGCTFYFASRSESGLGGWDIFRSNRDNEDGSFMDPVNMGMPYNSPGNDYMLVVDEETGFGWWASDRNHAEDENGEELITIYLFVPAEVRRNLPPETENLPFLASLKFGDDPSLINLTRDEGKDEEYSRLLDAIASVSPAPKAEKKDFTFNAPDGKIYTNYSQLPANARPLMQTYRKAVFDKERAEEELQSLYTASSGAVTDSLKARVQSAEKTLQMCREKELKALSAIEKSF